MNQKEWIEYFSLTNGRKPSKKEIKLALKDGEFSLSVKEKRKRKFLFFLVAVFILGIIVYFDSIQAIYYGLMSEKFDEKYEQIVDKYQDAIDSKSSAEDYKKILEQPSRQPSYIKVDSDFDGKEELYIVLNNGAVDYEILAAYEIKWGTAKKLDSKALDYESIKNSIILDETSLEPFDVESLLTMSFNELSEQNYSKIEGKWITDDGTAYSLDFNEEGLDMLNVQTHNEVYNEDGFGTELDIYDLEKGMFSGAFSEENTEFKFVFLPKGIEFEDSNKNYDRIFFRNEEIYFYRYDDIIGTLTEQPVDIIDLSSGDYSGIADDYSSIAGRWANKASRDEYIEIDEDGKVYLPWSNSVASQLKIEV